MRLPKEKTDDNIPDLRKLRFWYISQFIKINVNSSRKEANSSYMQIRQSAKMLKRIVDQYNSSHKPKTSNNFITSSNLSYTLATSSYNNPYGWYNSYDFQTYSI